MDISVRTFLDAHESLQDCSHIFLLGMARFSPSLACFGANVSFQSFGSHFQKPNLFKCYRYTSFENRQNDTKVLVDQNTLFHFGNVRFATVTV